MPSLTFRARDSGRRSNSPNRQLFTIDPLVRFSSWTRRGTIAAAWRSCPEDATRPIVSSRWRLESHTGPPRHFFLSFLRFSIVTNYCTCRLYLLVITKATANIVKRCDDVPQKLRFSPNAGSAIRPSSPILMRWPWPNGGVWRPLPNKTNSQRQQSGPKGDQDQLCSMSASPLAALDYGLVAGQAGWEPPLPSQAA